MYINSYDSNSIKTLFSGLNSSTNKYSFGSGLFGSSSLSGINFMDYASIKDGSYYKLMKAYYSKADSNDSSNASSKVNTSTSTAKDTSKKLASVESTAQDLSKTANQLLDKGTASVFNKVSKTDENGNVTNGYDSDAIYKKVSAFVDSYNSLIKATASTGSENIAKSATDLVNMTDKNKDLLNSAGITINEKDHTLSISKDKFNSADMSSVKSMFNSTGSYGYQVSAKASMIRYYAQNEILKANTYSKTGGYSYNFKSGEIYNSFV